VNPPQEKGIDVWLALEAYDLAVTNGFDVLALFVSDQDFLPLIRKMHGRCIRTAVVAVDIRYTDTQGIDRSLATSHQLTNESTYALNLSQEIDSERRDDKLIESIFAIPAKTPYIKPALGAPRRVA
jgi:uncharacterized LabA/DUF88 family protein